MKNKKGFTLIELLTVIAILGILVLLAAPKFLNYTEKANMVKIQTGIKSVETVIDLNYFENPELTKNWIVLDSDKIKEINDSEKLIDRNGLIKENFNGGKYIPLKDLDSVKWNSGGEFILSEDGESVYYYNKDLNISKNPDGSDVIPDNGDSTETTPPVEPETQYPIKHDNGDSEAEDGTITKPDGTVVLPDGSVILPDNTFIPVATDSDFIWIPDSDSNGYLLSGKGRGHYTYKGTATTVVIPAKIEGHSLPSYYRMFENTNVSKVYSYNSNIKSLKEMFVASTATYLDLTSINTSNVTNMDGLFHKSQAVNINLNNFKTEKVVNMNNMFYDSKAISLDLSSFNTSNVTEMRSMFKESNSTYLDLTNFNTSKVTNMESMFLRSEATVIKIESFNTSNVKDMSYMFLGTKINTLDLNFDISNTRNMISMFLNSSIKTLDFSNIDFVGTNINMSAYVTGTNITNAYAKNKANVDFLNNHTQTPSTLVFKTK